MTSLIPKMFTFFVDGTCTLILVGFAAFQQHVKHINASVQFEIGAFFEGLSIVEKANKVPILENYVGSITVC